MLVNNQSRRQALSLLGSAAMIALCVPASAQQASDVVEGEVRRIDKAAGKMTLRHDAMPNLDMPAMTMVFRVADPAMLERVKEGEKVRFTAEKIGGQFTVTKIDKAP